mmetsp:Transcript_136771/g.341050  ORF Transcript_136771/g.341050 Transcript_136771/m.341050 type:complete len:214 (-) Transcript_136771:425-1066(-)
MSAGIQWAIVIGKKLCDQSTQQSCLPTPGGPQHQQALETSTQFLRHLPQALPRWRRFNAPESCLFECTFKDLCLQPLRLLGLRLQYPCILRQQAIRWHRHSARDHDCWVSANDLRGGLDGWLHESGRALRVCLACPLGAKIRLHSSMVCVVRPFYLEALGPLLPRKYLPFIPSQGLLGQTFGNFCRQRRAGWRILCDLVNHILRHWCRRNSLC